MSEPRDPPRLRDEGGDLGALLDAAALDEARPEELRQLDARLAALIASGAGAATAAGGTGAAAGAATTAGAGAGAAGSAGAGGAAAGGFVATAGKAFVATLLVGALGGAGWLWTTGRLDRPTPAEPGAASGAGGAAPRRASHPPLGTRDPQPRTAATAPGTGASGPDERASDDVSIETSNGPQLGVQSGGDAPAAAQPRTGEAQPRSADVSVTLGDSSAAAVAGRARAGGAGAAPAVGGDRTFDAHNLTPNGDTAGGDGEARGGGGAEPTPREDELALLTAARAALGAGDTGEARALLERHARAFPASAFAEERDALRVEALAVSGDRGAAAAALGRFREKFPRSPYRARLERAAGEAP